MNAGPKRPRLSVTPAQSLRFQKSSVRSHAPWWCVPHRGTLPIPARDQEAFCTDKMHILLHNHLTVSSRFWIGSYLNRCGRPLISVLPRCGTHNLACGSVGKWCGATWKSCGPAQKTYGWVVASCLPPLTTAGGGNYVKSNMSLGTIQIEARLNQFDVAPDTGLAANLVAL